MVIARLQQLQWRGKLQALAGILSMRLAESVASLAEAVAAEAVQALVAQVRVAHSEQRFLLKMSEEIATGLVSRTWAGQAKCGCRADFRPPAENRSIESSLLGCRRTAESLRRRS